MTTSTASTAMPTEDEFSLSRVDFPASRTAPPACAGDATIHGTSGRSSHESLRRHDPLGLSLRTSLALELQRLTRCSLTWSRSATPAGRSWWVLSMPERHTDGKESGLLPTVTVGDSRNARNATAGRNPDSQHHDGTTLSDWVLMLPTPTQRDWKSGAASDETLNRNARPLNEVVTNQTGADGPMRLSPLFVAWLMGYPPGWLDVECQRSRRSATR